MKIITTAAARATLLASLAICTLAADNVQAQSRSRVTIAVTETIASVNPYADSVAMMYAIYCQTYGCLVDYSFDKGTYVGNVAESWTTPDPNTWVFKLKRGVKRHNGDPLVAADVAHSIWRSNNDPQSKQRHNTRDIIDVQTPDEHTVILKTKQPIAPLLDPLSQLIITSKALYDKHGPDADKVAQFGVGPYQIRQIAVDNFFAMTKFASHPDVKPENPDEIIFRIMKEPEARVTALLNGEIQMVQTVPPHLIPRVQSSPNARIVTEDSVEIMFLAMSPLQKPWDNKLARQAVAHAIDRDALIKVILQGQATRLDGPIGPGQYGYDPDLKPRYDYNPAKARELLKQAGYPNGVEIDFYATVGRYIADKQICEAIVPMLEAAGFKVNLKTPEWGTLWANVQKGGVPFYYMGRGSVIDPSAPLAQYFETGGSPRIQFSNKEVDTALQAERKEFDEKKRIALLRRAMSVITDEAPAHFMWRHKMASAISTAIDFKPLPSSYIWGTNITMRQRAGAAKK